MRLPWGILSRGILSHAHNNVSTGYIARIRSQSKVPEFYSDPTPTNLLFFGGEHGGHSVQVVPLCIDIGLEFFSVAPELAKASLLAGVGFYSRIVGTLIDAVADTIEYLVEWKKSTAYSNFD